jgi:hypothetical protein
MHYNNIYETVKMCFSEFLTLCEIIMASFYGHNFFQIKNEKGDQVWNKKINEMFFWNQQNFEQVTYSL